MSDDDTTAYFDPKYIGDNVKVDFKFAILPKKCYSSGRTIWWEKAYRQTFTRFGPGGIHYDYRWYDQKEFVVRTLKGLE